MLTKFVLMACKEFSPTPALLTTISSLLCNCTVRSKASKIHKNKCFINFTGRPNRQKVMLFRLLCIKSSTKTTKC